ncbi:MAG: zinc-binding dehydrogenase [Verrucomicrobia bacterium]|nr:zinc-binding dehydrogenase [Verrucomicrobiota bacterium]
MRTSRAAIFHGPNQPFTLVSVDVPEPREGEILVRNAYTTLCRSDLNTFCGKRTEKTPTILGHEIVGHIEEMGPGAPETDCRGNPLAVGDLVTWAIYASDPAAALSREGIPQKAPGLFKYGHERIEPGNHLHGGLADYCILRRHTPVIRITEAVPLHVLSLINCSVATMSGALRLAGPVEGRDVLVTGAGMLGVIGCAMCRSAGARHVIAVDVNDGRLDVAGKFGASVGLNAARDGGLTKESLAAALPGGNVTVAIDLSGVPETMERMIDVLGIGGIAVLVGATHPQRALAIDAERLVRNLHTIRGLHNYNDRDFVAAVDFMERTHRDYPFADLVEDGHTLEGVNEAFDRGLNSGAFRIGIRMSD